MRMSNNGDRPPAHTINISLDPATGQLTYRYTGCSFMQAIALLELAKLHVFNDWLVAQWQRRQKGGEGDASP